MLNSSKNHRWKS